MDTNDDGGPWEVAPKPPPRTVTVGIADGAFAGWKAEVVVDFPAAEIVDEVRSGDLARVLAVADRLIVRHNFPDRDGNLAPNMAAVDPWTGVAAILKQAMSALDSLPSR